MSLDMRNNIQILFKLWKLYHESLFIVSTFDCSFKMFSIFFNFLYFMMKLLLFFDIENNNLFFVEFNKFNVLNDSFARDDKLNEIKKSIIKRF